MSTYAIGDLQGCFDELKDLLDSINFDENRDQLWFTGDLVNRGPQSLECLRFVKSLEDNAITVLGNHDLHLLAVAQNNKHKRKKDTLDNILIAPDCDELLEWLKGRPLLHHGNDVDFVLIHAGLVPAWDLYQTIDLEQEVIQTLSTSELPGFLDYMYGNIPDHWSDDLDGWERIRFIINCFTRMRYCTDSGQLVFEEKGPPGSQAENIYPWFTIPSRKTINKKIIFGHWSTVHLGNISDFSEYNVFPLDTGCVWGGKLTALRLEDEEWFSVASRQQRKFDS